MPNTLIIGGGVIGLSLAWELARHDVRVQVVERGEVGKEASWAGAGILPPANRVAAVHPYDQLRALASELHPQWAEMLRRETGIDTGYRRCGGLYLARSAGEAASLAAWARAIADEGTIVEELDPEELLQVEPGLSSWGRLSACPDMRQGTGDKRQKTGERGQGQRFRATFRLPDEAQIRNPRHLQALHRACLNSGVEVTSHLEVLGFEIRDGKLAAVTTSAGSITAERFCCTSGAWTGQLCAKLGIPIGIMPIRGQMVLFNTSDPAASRGQAAPVLTHILNEGSRYIVPRDDGRILAGSTEEEVGFDKRTTEESIAELVAFARDLVPALADARVENTWAGLRPGSFDGLPYLGPLPGLESAFVASGHFRSGLFLSPATAVVMRQLLRGERPEIDITPFRVGR